mgnify:CR=1 FL=1
MGLEKILIGSAFASTLFLTSVKAQDFSPGLTVHPANPLYVSQNNIYLAGEPEQSEIMTIPFSVQCHRCVAIYHCATISG